ncbi:MAG: putative rane protein [Polaromonas sp.]|nr:putative rane protein [Polaromonas sp.]
MNDNPFLLRNPETPLQWLDRAMGLFGVTELLLALGFVVLALVVPRWGERTYARIEQGFTRVLGHNPVVHILAVGALAVLARALFLPWLGAPVPFIHDEQSLLLQAQTYMLGRLVNPTHPFWQHFETFHLNQVPAYASMYFPGRGAPLALGLLLAHQAWVGVWISFVAMCMASVWMLQGWVSRPMALLGGVLIVLRIGVFSYWVNSYWGGAFTAFGAMLVVGALPRVLVRPGWGHGILMGIGAVILLTTRPYEGALLCLPVGIYLMVHLLRPRWQGGRAAFARVALPVVLLSACAGGLLLEYNHATTGNYLKTAYSLNRETYAYAPAFLTSPPVKSAERGPPYFRLFYKAEGTNYDRRRSAWELLRGVAAKFYYTWNFYLGPTFTLAFMAGLWVARRQYFLVGTLLLFIAGYVIETWNFPHYTAPVFPVVLILTMRGFEWLRTFRPRDKPVGLFLTRAMPTAALLILLLPAFSLVAGKPALRANAHSNPCCAIARDNVRSLLMDQLIASPGKDLVLVKDGPNNPIHYEMVYNDADIDNSEVVWAHELGREQDLKLERYFGSRRLWEFEWLGATEPQPYRMTPLDPALETRRAP